MHGALVLAGALAIALDWRFAVDQRAAWLALQVPVAAAVLVYAWRRQRQLSLPLVLGLTLALHLVSILLFRHLGVTGDGDPNNTYLPEGHKLLEGTYPTSEYPVAAVLLFALESLVDPHPPQIANAFLMLPALLLCMWGIWSLRTRWSAWLALVVGFFPLAEYYWQFRYDGVVAAALVAGLLLARRGHFGWSGVVLAVGACLKWSPGLSSVVLVAWLVAARRFRDARLHVAAFLATTAAFYVPFLLHWPAHDVLASFRIQGKRLLTNESIWYWPARALGLTHQNSQQVWHDAGAPPWTNVVVTCVQVVLVLALAVAAARRPGRRDAVVALAALAPVVFLVTNRVFSVQFVLILAAGWAVAASLTAATRRQQLLAGGFVGGSIAVNAFVYPFGDPLGIFGWAPYTALSWIFMIGATLTIGRWALRGGPVAVEGVEEELPPLTTWHVERTLFAVAVGVAAILLAANLLVAATVPYGGWDSLYYGQWSRLIGLHGGFHFPAVVATSLHRPLFYVLQGELWRVAGFHEALGRLLSLAFTVLLVACLVRLAAVRWGRLGAAIAALVTLAITDVARHASDGLTDVPAAATLALVAVVVFTVRPGRRRTALLVLTALVAVLAKPTGIVGCASLCLALLVGPLDQARRRLVVDVLPIGAGVLLGLVYDWTQARHVGLGLESFLQSGVGSGIWAAKAAAARPDALWGWLWLGRPLHALVVFAILYALLRVAGPAHRTAVLVAVPAAWIWTWAGPAVAGHPLHLGWGATGLVTVVLLVSLPAAALAPADRVPTRLELARLLVWALPSYAIWSEYAAYDTRLLSAAWPALVLLLTAVAVPIVSGAGQRSAAVALVPVAALGVAALVSVIFVGGLGRAGWQQYRSGGWSGITDSALTANVAYGQFEHEVAALRRQLGPGERIYGEDGRLPFLFPGRAVYDTPKSCGDLRGYKAIVILFDDETIAQARLAGAPATLGDWEACRNPGLTLVAEEPSNYAVFVTGKPRVPPTPAACNVVPLPSGFYAVFGHARTQAAAEALRQAQAHYGFVQLKVVRTGCQRYLVLESITSPAMGPGIVQEAKSVGIDVTIRSVGGS